ncbi:MAG TPA: choice-of-anchor D domain-containing protein [Allocoleopsis sp.]
MATLTVTSTADNGTGSLREAIAIAQSGDTIVFAPTLANQTIGLPNNGQLIVNKSLTIDGANAPGLTISGSNTTRIFAVTTVGTSFTLKNLTLADAFLPGDLGGAINAEKQTVLTVENCQFNNNVSRGGGAIFASDRSTLSVTNCTFNGNDAATYGDLEISGGAISTLSKCNITITDSQFTNNKGINGGGIYSIFSNLTVENSTFTNNDSSSGGALGSPGSSAAGYTRGYGGAIYIDGASIPNDPRFYPDWQNGDAVGGTILISNSRIEGNTAAGEGGGMWLFGYPQDQVMVENSTIINNQVVKDNKGDAIGGGIRFGPTKITIDNSAIANNQAQTKGGGVYYDGESPVNITNSTFSGNKAQDTGNGGLGGAIYSNQWATGTTIVNTTLANNYAGSEAGAIFQGNYPLAATNSIFANNSTGNPGTANQQTNVVLVGGNNLQSPGSGNNATANITIADPLLGALQTINGRLVHPLLPGSPAIDAGTSVGAPSTDEIGTARPQDGDLNGSALVDIGAYEAPGTLTPEIQVLKGTTDIADGTTVPLNFGNTAVGTPLVQTFTIANLGTAALNLSNLQLPTGFSLVGTLPATVAPQAQTALQIQLDATAVGTASGELSFATNDSNENPFNFAISGTVGGTTGGTNNNSNTYSVGGFTWNSNNAVKSASIIYGQPGTTVSSFLTQFLDNSGQPVASQTVGNLLFGQANGSATVGSDTAPAAILLNWGGQGLTNQAGDDFVIYENGNAGAPEAFGVGVVSATTGQISNYRYEFANSFDDANVGAPNDGQGVFSTGFDLSDFGIAPGDAIASIVIANLLPSDRVSGADGQGVLGSQYSYTPLTQPGGQAFAADKFDPDITFVTGLHDVGALPSVEGDALLNGGQQNKQLTGHAGSDTFVLASGQGQQTIVNFEEGIDRIGLSGGLSFGQLTLTGQGNDTLINVTSTGELLATVSNVNSALLTSTDFVTVS